LHLLAVAVVGDAQFGSAVRTVDLKRHGDGLPAESVALWTRKFIGPNRIAGRRRNPPFLGRFPAAPAAHCLPMQYRYWFERMKICPPTSAGLALNALSSPSWLCASTVSW